jgi:hypothetical protein
MKNTAFWDMILCNLVKRHRRFRGTCCLLFQAPGINQTVHSFESSMNFYRTTWRYVREDFGSRRTVKHKNFLAHFVYKIKNIFIYFKLWIQIYTNGFLLIFKIYFHNIRGTPFENHWNIACCSQGKQLYPVQRTGTSAGVLKRLPFD